MELNEALEYFLIEQQLKGNTPKTIKGYKGFLNNFIAHMKGQGVTQVGEIKILHINKYQLYVSNKKKDRNEKKQLTKTSVQTYMRHVRVFMKFCYEKKFTFASLHNEMILPKGESPAIEILTDDEIMAILSCFSKSEMGLRNTAIVCLMLDCGLRIGEITKIKVSDINFDKGYVCIMGKGQKGRIVPLGLKMRKALMNYVYKRRMSSSEQDNDEYFFLTKQRQPVTVNSVKSTIDRVKIKTGITRLHAHLLRHTYATNFLINGLGDIYELSRLLGHADVKITERYLHIASYYKIIEKRKKKTYLDLIE